MSTVRSPLEKICAFSARSFTGRTSFARMNRKSSASVRPKKRAPVIAMNMAWRRAESRAVFRDMVNTTAPRYLSPALWQAWHLSSLTSGEARVKTGSSLSCPSTSTGSPLAIDFTTRSSAFPDDLSFPSGPCMVMATTVPFLRRFSAKAS